jgi:hypothetical protein
MTRSEFSRLAVLRVLFFVMLAFALAKAFVLPHKTLRLFHWDKAEHFTAFYVLTVLAAAAFPRRSLPAIAAALSLLGAGIEVVQAMPFVARDSDVWDWVADTVAIAAAMLPLALPAWRRKAAAATPAIHPIPAPRGGWPRKDGDNSRVTIL